MMEPIVLAYLAFALNTVGRESRHVYGQEDKLSLIASYIVILILIVRTLMAFNGVI